MSNRSERIKELEEQDVPIRSYTLRNCPFSPKTQYNEYHAWYYKNIYAKAQSTYYAKKRAEAKKCNLENVETVE